MKAHSSGRAKLLQKQLHELSRFEHDRTLSKPEYVRVLLNPLPVYGLAVGVLGLFIALLLRTRAARVTAFALVMLSAASAWPVYQYGEAGYDRVQAMVDEDGLKGCAVVISEGSPAAG